MPKLNRGFLEFAIKGIVFLVLVYFILSAFYQKELQHASFFAQLNTLQLLIVGLVFSTVSWKKLSQIKQFKYRLKSVAVFGIIAIVFLGARYLYPTIPFRVALTAIGFLALFTLVFSYWFVKVLLSEYKKELLVTIIIAIIIQALMIAFKIRQYYYLFY